MAIAALLVSLAGIAQGYVAEGILGIIAAGVYAVFFRWWDEVAYRGRPNGRHGDDLADQ